MDTSIMLQTNPSIFKKLFCVALIVGSAISGSALAQEPDPKDLLARMGAEIAELESFVLSGDVYADARLDAGQIIEHSYDASMSVRKPSQLRLTNLSGENTKELFFDAGILTVYDSNRDFYAQKPIPDGFLNAIDFALNDLGIKAPLLELISRNFAENVMGGEAELAYMGTSLFRGEMHDHIAIRGPEVDMQLWIAAEAPHLPKKMALVSKWEGGAPRFVGFMSWDTSAELSDDSFKFTPPEGATEINFIPEL
jgi:hypothetical protein